MNFHSFIAYPATNISEKITNIDTNTSQLNC